MKPLERIVVAFIGEELRRKTLHFLAAEGMEAAAVCTSGAEVIRMVRQMGSAVVICGFYLRDMTADTLAADLRGVAAVMAVAKASHLELCGGENLFKLPVPASRSEFFATLGLMLDFESAHLRHPASQRREEDQRLIRRQGTADGCQPHDRGRGPPVSAKAQYGAGHQNGGGCPAGN